MPNASGDTQFSASVNHQFQTRRGDFIKLTGTAQNGVSLPGDSIGETIVRIEQGAGSSGGSAASGCTGCVKYRSGGRWS